MNEINVPPLSASPQDLCQVAAGAPQPARSQAPFIVDPQVAQHPLFPVFCAAIAQAIYGKGKRHGGGATPFLDQPIFHYARMHGRGFLTGQAAKKLEEAASTRDGEAFVTEVLGAIVYAGAAILREQGKA